MNTEDLIAYVDGELAPAERERVEAEIARGPDSLRLLSDLCRQRLLLAEALREAAPAAMGQPAPAVRTPRALPPARLRPIPPRRFGPAGWLAACAMLALTGGLFYWLLLRERPRTAVVEKTEKAPAEDKKPAPPEGRWLRSEVQSLKADLGDYCRLTLEPRSALKVEGDDSKGEVFLQEGGVTCDVVRTGRAFRVRTEAGSVHVSGTKFTVRYFPVDAKRPDVPARLHVKVLEGAVVMKGGWGDAAVKASEDCQSARGTVSAVGGFDQGEIWASIRFDGEDAPWRCMAVWRAGRRDAEIQRLLGELKAGERVDLVWRQGDAIRHVLGFKQVPREERAK